jgi:hypothetical protein
VNGSWVGWLCWAERIGGLAVCAGLRCKMEGVLQTSTDVVKAQSGRDGFSNFLSSYLNYDSNLNLEFKFESHTIKMQNKSHKIQGSHTSKL